MIKNYFFSAKYIFRLDDACEYSDLKKWKLIEKIFDKNNIKPIVAVIPNNKDYSLHYSKFNNNFWSKVKSWEDKGWTIALHGYNHIYHKVKRTNQLFPYYDRSEFTGLSIQAQKTKIKKALAIFKSNGIYPKIWVAPSHCFDYTTMDALKQETNINMISDGISFYPYFSKGFHFIPQQIWKLKYKLFGLWTVCLHPDTMSYEDISSFEKKISAPLFKDNVVNVGEIKLYKRKRSVLDILFSYFFWIKYEIRQLIKLKK